MLRECPWGDPASTSYGGVGHRHGGLWGHPPSPAPQYSPQEGQEERPAGWLRQRPETPIHPNLQRPALGETLITDGQHWVAQLMEDITQRMGKSHQLECYYVPTSHLGDRPNLLCLPTGNVSSRGAAGLREGHQVVLSDIHHAHEKDQDVYSQLGGHAANPVPVSFFCTGTPLGAALPAESLIPMTYPSPPHAESDLALLLAQQRRVEEVMEKLRQVNQSLGLMLATTEDARSRLENHLRHLHAVLDPAGELEMGAGGWMGAGGCQRQALAPCPAGWSPSAISTCILHGSYFVLLAALLVPMLPRPILLLFFLASSALGELLGVPALSALLALAVAGGDGSGGT